MCRFFSHLFPKLSSPKPRVVMTSPIHVNGQWSCAKYISAASVGSTWHWRYISSVCKVRLGRLSRKPPDVAVGNKKKLHETNSTHIEHAADDNQNCRAKKKKKSMVISQTITNSRTHALRSLLKKISHMTRIDGIQASLLRAWKALLTSARLRFSVTWLFVISMPPLQVLAFENLAAFYARLCFLFFPLRVALASRYVASVSPHLTKHSKFQHTPSVRFPVLSRARCCPIRRRVVSYSLRVVRSLTCGFVFLKLILPPHLFCVYACLGHPKLQSKWSVAQPKTTNPIVLCKLYI